MTISSTTFNNRSGWLMDNACVRLVVLAGGGHIASIEHRDTRGLNPLWKPRWKSIEPWAFNRNVAPRYGGSKLLAAICGHNICLGAFGDPSPEEKRAGLDCHYEAPVARWRLVRRKRTPRVLTLRIGATLPVFQMNIVRTISMRRNSTVVTVTERIASTAKRDLPYTMCQHVTFGAPFVEKGVTLFDANATKGHTFPGTFGAKQRLKKNAAFAWPNGCGEHGAVDLRRIGREFRSSSDFYTLLMDRKSPAAWFSAVNPQRGLLVAYVWNREEYPWLGTWEENFCRAAAPWNRNELTRGMEFANSPFPLPLRDEVNMGSFQGLPTFRWLPARGKAAMTYHIVVEPVGRECKGVKDIAIRGGKAKITFA
ncbi:hypothetical protein GX586_12470 [bacterium]|nr:hypothetical protein [bacterium]